MRRARRRGLSTFQAGLILIIGAVVLTYLGFTKAIPFRHHFTIKGVFHTSNNIRTNSFVRIAGVNVGKVTKIEHVRKGEPDAVLTMRIDNKGKPIHKDAFAVIRPRIFLEGNFFVDLHPGTPQEPILGDGDTIQASRTATPVQFDQILTTLDSDTRFNLKRLLEEYSTGLAGNGGVGFNKSIAYWESAYKNSAIVNDATLGQAQHDLSGYIASAGTVAQALDRSPEALKSLITDLNTTANAFAREQDNLEQAVAELPRTLRAARPALAALNAAFPPVRRLVVDLRPAVRSSGPTIDASLPFVRQARKLVSKAELRGLVADLVPTVPALARLNNATVSLLHQLRLASSCQNQVILPWSRDEIHDPNFPTNYNGGTIQLKVYEESVRFLPAIAGESRTGDANGQWFRVLPGNGTNTYDLGVAGQTVVGQSLFPLLGANPPRLSQPPVRPHVPCETQHKPDLTTIQGASPTQLASKSTPASKLVQNESAAYIAAWIHNQQVRQQTPKPTAAQAKQLAATDKKLGDLRKKWVEDFKKMAGG
jgi:phospholipid/cholesterol/gamma-HCH transport system substrate-binding protein